MTSSFALISIKATSVLKDKEHYFWFMKVFKMRHTGTFAEWFQPSKRVFFEFLQRFVCTVDFLSDLPVHIRTYWRKIRESNAKISKNKRSDQSSWSRLQLLSWGFAGASRSGSWTFGWWLGIGRWRQSMPIWHAAFSSKVSIFCLVLVAWTKSTNAVIFPHLGRGFVTGQVHDHLLGQQQFVEGGVDHGFPRPHVGRNRFLEIH